MKEFIALKNSDSSHIRICNITYFGEDVSESGEMGVEVHTNHGVFYSWEPMEDFKAKMAAGEQHNYLQHPSNEKVSNPSFYTCLRRAQEIVPQIDALQKTLCEIVAGLHISVEVRNLPKECDGIIQQLNALQRRYAEIMGFTPAPIVAGYGIEQQKEMD
jgi:response regulator RpfG family c-di-GMP phosphodiesterase